MHCQLPSCAVVPARQRRHGRREDKRCSASASAGALEPRSQQACERCRACGRPAGGAGLLHLWVRGEDLERRHDLRRGHGAQRGRARWDCAAAREGGRRRAQALVSPGKQPHCCLATRLRLDSHPPYPPAPAPPHATHLVLGRVAADIEEVGGGAAAQLDDIHGSHGQPRAVDLGGACKGSIGARVRAGCGWGRWGAALGKGAAASRSLLRLPRTHARPSAADACPPVCPAHARPSALPHARPCTMQPMEPSRPI